MKLILIRGLPGSGKSTMAKAMTGCFHVEADMYFCQGGEYVFDFTKLREAHAWCQEQTAKKLAEGCDVVVTNTFTQKWEMEPYFKMAEQAGAELEILVATGNYGNIHGVPAEAVERMKARWEVC